LITISFSSVNSGSIQLNTAYQWSVNGSAAIVATINYEAKNCGPSASQYMNITGGTTSGTGPSLPFSCTFSNVSYN